MELEGNEDEHVLQIWIQIILGWRNLRLDLKIQLSIQ